VRRATKEGQPLRGFLANPGQVLQFINQAFNGSSKIGHA